MEEKKQYNNTSKKESKSEAASSEDETQPVEEDFHGETSSSYVDPEYSPQFKDSRKSGNARISDEETKNEDPEKDPLPSKLDIGSMAEVSIKGQTLKYGVIRWIGFTPNSDKKLAGLELEEELDACSDGTFLGKRYFTCPNRRGFFLHLHNCLPDSRFERNSIKSDGKKRLTETVQKKSKNKGDKPLHKKGLEQFSKKEKEKTKYNNKNLSETLTNPTKAEISHQKTEEDEKLNCVVVDKAKQYRILLGDLNLEANSKLTLKKARTVDNHTLKNNKLTSPHQIPDYILNTLMIVNYNARKFKLKCVSSDQHESKNSDFDNSNGEYGINPMDALLAIFHCSDDFLRRHIAIKLSACQVSVPFLLPDPVAPSENVTILLTALESITKTWKNNVNDRYDSQQVFATEFSFPVVSFIRIGKNTISKSSLINKIMSSSNQAHDVFFHKDMKGGNVERKIVDGLVEIAWYLPSGSEEKMLQNGICFANLRGEGGDFKKQLDFMSDISSVLCLLLTSEYPNKTKKYILDMTTRSQAKVIIIFNEKIKKDAKKYFSEFRERNREKLTFVTKSNRWNEYDFVQRIRVKIHENINAVEAVPLVELASCASEYDIHLDGILSHLKFKERVNNWLKIGAKDLLKLQKHVPVLADLEREIYCPRRNNKSKGKRIERDIDEIYAKLEEEKKKQKHSFNVMDEWVIQCLNDFALMDKNDRNYALVMLTHQLKKMQMMPRLHEEHHVATLSEEDNLKQPKESISKCSFGLEHILKELAQLYQLSDISPIDYAGAAAEMLLSGHPLELVDGDSFYIPLRWFDAVYTKLESKTNNAKIFVISVLGIQSSGKSTMLNTMFGLELPVSAGKCTRGAFASLIPVSDSLKITSEFNYILIIDTEGFQGSGDPQLRERDNELVTFAIGVADVTIVNIFGENNDGMKEFLEKAVHAFLKMKLAKKKKDCKIIHQNVAATDATSKLAMYRVKLKEDLDKMIKVAATQENCEDQFEKLNDIISFDENKDVFYIPNLLEGCPPMAPVSPNYGKAIQRVKEDIISLMSSSSSQSSISQFRERVIILWKAMLTENFVVSFRKTIEVRAYTALDKKYFEFVNLIVIELGELEKKIQVVLKRCANRNERIEKWRSSKIQIRDEAKELGEKMKQAMKKFVETDEDKLTLEQWSKDIIDKITQQKANLVTKVTRNCQATFDYLENQQNFHKKKQIYEKGLLEKAKEFITSRYDIEDLSRWNEEFEQEWEQWIEDVPQCEEQKLDVNEQMVDVLCNANADLNLQMTEKLNEQSRSIINFKEIVPAVNIDQLIITRIGQVQNCFQQYKQQCLYTANVIKDQTVNKGISFAKEKLRSGVKCCSTDLTKMYLVIVTEIEEETKNHYFKFSKSIKCDILLHTFAKVYKIFEKMEERYFEEQDIRGNFEKRLRPKLQKHISNLCHKIEKDVIAAISIVDCLQKPIELELNRIMGLAVVGELLKKSEFQSKGQFHASVLIKLGQEANFQTYITYLENPVEFLRKKLKDSVKNFCQQHAKMSPNSLLKNKAKKIEDHVFAAISIATDKLVESGNKKVSFWIQQFVEACSTLEITEETFAVAAIDENLHNISVFEKKVREHLTQFMQSLINDEADCAAIKKWNPSPHDHLFTFMFGCQSVCPFCKSLCDQTAQNHAGSHSTRIHRPLGLIGYRIMFTGALNTSVCTTSVAGKGTFRNAYTSHKIQPYKDYKLVNDYYNSWSISPDLSFVATNYWQWFMAKFSKKLTVHYYATEPDIPSPWKLLSFKDVKEQLEYEYKL